MVELDGPEGAVFKTAKTCHDKIYYYIVNTHQKKIIREIEDSQMNALV